MTFNGGPDNCPAELLAKDKDRSPVLTQPPFNGGPDNCPAERVRYAWTNDANTSAFTFNGGPDNCPAEPEGSQSVPP